MSSGRKVAEKLGLPPKPFFYTADQLAALLEVTVEHVEGKLLHYEGRSVGICPSSKMPAINVNPGGEPIWRINERHLMGWLRKQGMRFYTRGY